MKSTNTISPTYKTDYGGSKHHSQSPKSSAGVATHINITRPGYVYKSVYSLVEAEMKSLASVPQEGMSVAVGNVAGGLSVDGRYHVSLPDTLLRRLAARVHLWDEEARSLVKYTTPARQSALWREQSNKTQECIRCLKFYYILSITSSVSQGLTAAANTVSEFHSKQEIDLIADRQLGS
jgi:hypothetical protein